MTTGRPARTSRIRRALSKPAWIVAGTPRCSRRVTRLAGPAMPCSALQPTPRAAATAASRVTHRPRARARAAAAAGPHAARASSGVRVGPSVNWLGVRSPRRAVGAPGSAASTARTVAVAPGRLTSIQAIVTGMTVRATRLRLAVSHDAISCTMLVRVVTSALVALLRMPSPACRGSAGRVRVGRRRRASLRRHAGRA